MLCYVQGFICFIQSNELYIFAWRQPKIRGIFPCMPCKFWRAMWKKPCIFPLRWLRCPANFLAYLRILHFHFAWSNQTCNACLLEGSVQIWAEGKNGAEHSYHALQTLKHKGRMNSTLLCLTRKMGWCLRNMVCNFQSTFHSMLTHKPATKSPLAGMIPPQLSGK